MNERKQTESIYGVINLLKSMDDNVVEREIVRIYYLTDSQTQQSTQRSSKQKHEPIKQQRSLNVIHMCDKCERLYWRPNKIIIIRTTKKECNKPNNHQMTETKIFPIFFHFDTWYICSVQFDLIFHLRRVSNFELKNKNNETLNFRPTQVYR